MTPAQGVIGDRSPRPEGNRFSISSSIKYFNLIWSIWVIFCLFILLMGFLREEYSNGLPFSPLADHILSSGGGDGKR